LIISALVVLSACQKSSTATLSTKSTPPANANQTPDAFAEVPRIKVEDAKKDFDAGTAVFVDTRSEYAYNIEHIKGAMSLPMEKFEERYKDIPTGKKIIAYCD
jgi:predicted sulfurtransferase